MQVSECTIRLSTSKDVLDSDGRDYAVQEASLVRGYRMFKTRQATSEGEGWYQ